MVRRRVEEGAKYDGNSKKRFSFFEFKIFPSKKFLLLGMLAFREGIGYVCIHHLNSKQ
jgi:hypothetical protein